MTLLFTFLSTFLGSSAFGTIIGGIFAALNRKADLDAKRIDNEHEARRWANDIAMRNKDIELAQAEAAGRKDVAIIEGDASIETARMQAIAAAQAADIVTADQIKAAGSWGWLLAIGSAMRILIRPVLTVVLTLSAIYLNWLLIDLMRDGWPGMTPGQKLTIGMAALGWITVQASSVISYWFVVRGNTK